MKVTVSRQKNDLCITLLFLDINECNAAQSLCAPFPTGSCTNTEGSYECQCNQGFSGDGYTCEGESYPQYVYNIY